MTSPLRLSASTAFFILFILLALQLRTEEFAGANFYWPHAIADSSKGI